MSEYIKLFDITSAYTFAMLCSWKLCFHVLLLYKVNASKDQRMYLDINRSDPLDELILPLGQTH